jgi:RNA polymerase sigma-70 factor (ECF subfamily)
MMSEHFKYDIISLRQKLLITALRLMQNEEDAEDAVQETLLRMWNIRQEMDTVVNPAAFAMQTLKNICIDRLRTRREQADIEDSLMVESFETPYRQMERNDMAGIVSRIIESLPELQKIIIRMRDIEGYELQEIAGIVQIHVSAVRMNLSRARKRVREQLIKIMNYGT